MIILTYIRRFTQYCQIFYFVHIFEETLYNYLNLITPRVMELKTTITAWEAEISAHQARTTSCWQHRDLTTILYILYSSWNLEMARILQPPLYSEILIISQYSFKHKFAQYISNISVFFFFFFFFEDYCSL